MTPRRPADPAALLTRAIAAHAGGFGDTVRLGEAHGRPWASATFEGERVTLALCDVDPGAAWLAGLPNADLPVRGHFVADLVVHAAEGSTVRIQALLLRDA